MGIYKHKWPHKMLNSQRQCQQRIIEHYTNGNSGAIVDDLIYAVINWVQTFILTLSGDLLQTEFWSYAEGNKRLWVHPVFQQDTRLLCQEAQCSPELWWNYGSCEYNKQSAREKSQSWEKPTLTVFVKEPNVLLSSGGITPIYALTPPGLLPHPDTSPLWV